MKLLSPSYRHGTRQGALTGQHSSPGTHPASHDPKRGAVVQALQHLAWLLQESKRNVLKDFVHIAGPLGVTQFLILTATENACYLRIAKAPRVSHRLFTVNSESAFLPCVPCPFPSSKSRLPSALPSLLPIVTVKVTVPV